MNLLVLNSGSGSHRCSLFQLEDGVLPDEPLEPSWQAEIDTTAPGQPKGKFFVRIRVRGSEKPPDSIRDDLSRSDRIAKLLTTLWEGANPVMSGPEQIDAIGHRIVHGGKAFDSAVIVNSEVEAAIRRFAAFAPLHNESSLEGIRIAREKVGAQIPQIAVFDTTFHRTLPDFASIYAGPYDWISKDIRRYGFHGTSFRWASTQAERLLKPKPSSALCLILCHLSGGCSLAATVDGKSIDTTMGLTPLDGIAMCTRSGSIDPGILLYLQRQGMDAEEIERILNKESGLKGLSGLPGDTRIILPEARKGNEHARLAMDVFIHCLRAGIAQMLAALGERPHAVVFTGDIGETELEIRAAACEPFAFLGLRIDAHKNEMSKLDSNVAANDSMIQVLLIKSREEWQIARETSALISATQDRKRFSR